MSLLLAAQVGCAATLQFTELPANFLFGTYNGFATGTLDNIPGQLFICDDFDHTTYMPSGAMTYYESSLVDYSNPLAYARFNNSGHGNGAILKYDDAALLVNGLSQQTTGSLVDLTADYQYALWHLFTPSVPLPDSNAQDLLRAAIHEAHHSTADDQAIYARLQIFTPAGQFASNQEFLSLTAAPLYGTQGAPGTPNSLAAPVPEPSPMLLVFAGLGLMAVSAGVGRVLRRRRGNPYVE